MEDLLELALQAHGGHARWTQVQQLRARVSLTGQLYQLKGYPNGLTDLIVTLDPKHPALVLQPFGGADQSGHFSPERVWIEDKGGHITQERRQPLESFAGQRLESQWDALHALYFTGYALWNYLTTPFLFTRPGFRTKEGEPHHENGELWRRLVVTFPNDIPTHNGFQPGGEQSFYFNEQGLLQRLDYLAVGPASHYCFDHKAYGGIVFPTLRRVVRRTAEGPLVNGPSAVLLQVFDVEVT
jgi:hypothetical protein